VKKPNDVGAIWKKSNERGEYLSISLDVDALLELSGGVMGKLNINGYPISSEHPNAPDFQLKFYPKGAATSRPAPVARTKPVNEDDIPF